MLLFSGGWNITLFLRCKYFKLQRQDARCVARSGRSIIWPTATESRHSWIVSVTSFLDNYQRWFTSHSELRVEWTLCKQVSFGIRPLRIVANRRVDYQDFLRESLDASRDDHSVPMLSRQWLEIRHAHVTNVLICGSRGRRPPKHRPRKHTCRHKEILTEAMKDQNIDRARKKSVYLAHLFARELVKCIYNSSQFLQRWSYKNANVKLT